MDRTQPVQISLAGADSYTVTPFSVRCCDALVLAFAGWTLACNVVVFCGGSFDDLLIISAIAALVASSALFALRRFDSAALGESRVPGAGREEDAALITDSSVLSLHSRVIGLIGALAITVFSAYTQDIPMLWVFATLYLMMAFAQIARQGGSRWSAPRAGRRWERAVWGLAICAGLLPLIAHKFSSDDGFYVNLAIAALDHPELPLFRTDTLHGIPGLSILRSIYQLSSYELLGAATAFISGLPAINAFHWILPALFGPFVVFAYARLHRELAPERWLWSLCAALAVLILIEETQQYYGGFSLLRMQQGKAAFVSIFAPLTIVYGIQFARCPNRWNWALLFAVQVAAVGATTTALWAAPAIAGLALVSGASITKRGLRTVFIGFGASVYSLAMALLFRERMTAESSLKSASEEEGVRLVAIFRPLISDGAELVAAAWSTVNGSGVFSAVCFFAMLATWTLCRNSVARRLSVVFPLALLLIFMNPWTALTVAREVTGGPTYWRVLWILPLPSLLGVLLSSPLDWRTPRLPVAARAAIALLCTVVVVAWMPAKYALSSDARARWELFGLDVEPIKYAPAEALVARVPAGGQVLVPAGVSTWVTTFHHHPYPLVTRKAYLIDRGVDDAERRLRLFAMVSGQHHPKLASELESGIEDYDLAGICFRRDAGSSDAIRRVLIALDFEQIHENERYETWVVVAGAPAPGP